jgi:hypothetical protein
MIRTGPVRNRMLNLCELLCVLQTSTTGMPLLPTSHMLQGICAAGRNRPCQSNDTALHASRVCRTGGISAAITQVTYGMPLAVPKMACPAR